MNDQSKAERVKAVNKFLSVIGNCGRKFFFHKGKVSCFKVDPRGRVWFVDSATQRRIYTHPTGFGNRWRGFSEGGTLRTLVEKLSYYIRTGEAQRLNLGPWPEWVCGGDLWGYGSDMELVRQAAAQCLAHCRESGMQVVGLVLTN